MKKVSLLFTIFLAAITHNASAQAEIAADSVQVNLSADATKAPLVQNVVINIDSLNQQRALAANYTIKNGLYQKKAVVIPDDSIAKPLFAAVTDNVLQACLNEKITVNMDDLKDQFAAIATDSLRARIPQKMPSAVTSLKQQIGLVSNDTLRAAYYQKIANYYLRYDSITIKRTKQYYQDEALEFTMKALHSYSKYNDTPGLITSFDNLVKIYKDQKKFSQAKWFVLQSNAMSRLQNDRSKVISTLVDLAGIKVSIKDYKLAMRDLNEALALSTQYHYAQQEASVQQGFALLYARMNEPKKAAQALKRHDAILDSLLKAEIKAETAQRLATLKTQDSTQLAKKKLYTSVNSAGKKASKTSSYKKTVSL